MIPFLALFYSSLNIEFKNEVLHHVLVLVFSQVYVTRCKMEGYVGELVDYDDISSGWEMV